MASKFEGDYDPSEIYQTLSRVEQTEAAKSFSESISINQFMKDLSFRFKDDYAEAVQLYIYFFTKESTYKLLKRNSYGEKQYVVFRPEMITFVKYNKETKKTKNVIRIKGLGVYDDYGVRFETSIPQRKWDDSNKRYLNEVKMDSKGDVMLKRTRELKTDCKVNMIQINTKEKVFVKKAGTFDICDTEVHYYDWRVLGVKDDRNDSKLMMSKLYPDIEQFTNEDAELNDKATADEDLEMEIADDDEDES